MGNDTALSLKNLNKSKQVESFEVDGKKNKFDLADIAMILFFTQRFFTFVLTEVFGNYGIFLFMGALLVVYMVAVVQKFRQGNKLAIVVFISLLLFLVINIFISLLRHPELDFWFFGSEWNVVLQWADPRKSLAGLLVILLVKDKDRILRNLHIVGVVMFWYLLFQVLLFEYIGHWGFYYSSGDEGGTYNMSLGYEFVFTTIVLLTTGIRKKPILYSVMASVAAALTIYYGSRGSMIVLLVFMVLRLLFVQDEFEHLPGKLKNWQKGLIFTGLFVAAIGVITVLIIPALQLLLQFAYTHTSNIGLVKDQLEGVDITERAQSRNLEALSSGDFLRDGGRFRIWNLSFEAFKDNPIFGQGFFADRLYVGKEFYWGYSHNLLFEMMSHFGIFGILIIAFIVIWTVRTLIKKDNNEEKLLVILFGSMCMKLLISDSYAFYSHFWVFVALIVLNLTEGKTFKIKRVAAVLGGATAAAIVIGVGFVTVDYRNQSYSTIAIDEPSILLTTTGYGDEIYVAQDVLLENGYVATSFLNPGNTLAGVDNGGSFHGFMTKLIDAGWTFEDGNYYYENPYIRTTERQDDNREQMNEYLSRFGQEAPVAFNAPYSSMNSSVQYRLMENYSFAQQQYNARAISPYKNITYPEAMDLRAASFAWSDEAMQDNLISYLERAKENGSLAIVNIHLPNVEREDLEEFVSILNELDLQQINYKDLEARTHNEDKLDFMNYIENTYLFQLIANFL